MAKKGAAVQLQLEVENEEDWKKLVVKEGLIVVDVYSDWCGPCSGMLGNLRKLKLEVGGDALILATAKSDNIQCLERFRNRSEPTWMFIASGKMIQLMFGANAPRLIRLITDEIHKTKEAMANGTPREGIKFDELTDEEQERVNAEARVVEEAARIEEEEKERKICERRIQIVNNMAECTKELNFVLIYPHVPNEAVSAVNEAFNDTDLTVVGKQPTKTKLTDEKIYEMTYFSSWKLSEDAIERIKEGDVIGILFTAPLIDFEASICDIVRKKIYGESMCPPGSEGSLAQKYKIVIEKPIPQPEPEPQEVGTQEPEGEEETDTKTEDDQKETNNQESKPNSKEEEPPLMMEVEIPGLWVAENEKTKAAALRILFPLVVAKFELPEPEPIPPHLAVAFDAFKKNEVLQLASEYPFETMKLGFFTSSDPETAKLLAKTSEQYDALPVKPYDGKLILQVAKKKSEPLLSYSLLGPTYVSANTVIGEKECKMFFPAGYDEPEVEVEKEEVKKSKKKRKAASKASVGSTPSKESGESGEVREDTTEEGLEGVEEEEGELPDDLVETIGDDVDELKEDEELSAAEVDKATSPME